MLANGGNVFSRQRKNNTKNQLSFSNIMKQSLSLNNYFRRLWRDMIWNALEKIIISLIIQRIRYSGGVNEYGECHGMGSLILSYNISPAPAPATAGPFPSQINREHD